MPEKHSRIFLYFFLLLFSSLFIFRIADEKKELVAMDGDGKGYYAYLPAVFITHSLDWEKLNEIKPGYTNDFLNEYEGSKVNKYSPGTALFMFPFFLLATLISYAANQPLDGFSFLFQYSIVFAGIFYLFIGLIYLRKLLQTFSISDKNAFITLLAFILGTNLLYYSAYEPSMSHVYAFCCINMFLYFARKLFISNERKFFYLSVIFYALTVLIRPTHLLLILLIPFLSGTTSRLTVLSGKKIIAGAAITTAIISLQPLTLFLQTGNFFVNPYQDEGFYFTHPEFMNFLFSFRKGLFIYTPLLLVSLAGLFYLFKENKRNAILLTSYFLLLTYIFSSWWNWYYGDSFGQRIFIDYYSLFIISFALLLEKSKPLIRNITLSFAGICAVLNLVQTHQYKEHIIHPDAMNFEKYKAVFLKTGIHYKYQLNGEAESFYAPEGISTLRTYTYNKFHPYNDLGDKGIKCDALFVSNTSEYEDILRLNTDTVAFSDKRAYISITCSYIKTFNWNDDQTMLVVSLDEKENTYFRKGERFFSLEKVESGTPFEAKFGFRLPEIKPNSILKIYIWNKGKKEFKIYDIKTQIWEASLRRAQTYAT